MLRLTIPDRSEQRSLLGSQYRVFDVTAVESLPLGEFRQEKSAVTQRELNLLIRQQPSEELDSSISAWKCDGHALLKAIENLWIDLIKIARCSKKEDVTISVLRAL